MRAIRYRYLPRSRGDNRVQTSSYALRAARTARSTSSAPAALTSASTSSVAGLMVLNGWPSAGSTNSPPMNRPYDDRISTMARDSGAGAYSNFIVPASVERELIGSGVASRRHPLPLHQQVVEQARRAQPEPVRVEPVAADRLVDQDEIPDRVLGGADAT